MLHARFKASAGQTKADADAYCTALNAVYFEPWLFSFPNLAAKANPLSPSAAWAIDISIDTALAGNDPNDGSLYRAPQSPDVVALVPIPVGSDTFEWDTNDPEWNAPVVGP